MTRRALVIVIFRGLLIDSIDRLYWSIGLLFSAGGILYNVVCIPNPWYSSFLSCYNTSKAHNIYAIILTNTRPLFNINVVVDWHYALPSIVYTISYS